MWRNLLHGWIQQQARAKIYEHARDAALHGQPLGDEPTPPPCDVAMVFALAIESGALQDRMGRAVVTQGENFTVRQGHWAERDVAIIESGLGCEAATRGAELVIAGHRPQWVISAGFAGGLRDDLQRGDIVMADSLVDAHGGRLAIDLKIGPEQLAATKRMHVGRLVTVDEIVATSHDKRALAAEHEAIAVDMESYAVGEICRREKVRFLCVRVISDAVDETLPTDLRGLAEPRSVAGKLGAVTGALWRRPSSAKDMLRLKLAAVEASERLATFLEGVVTQLSPRARQEPSP